MDVKHRPSFSPDYAVAPGETLRELLSELELSQSDLAERTGRPKKTINEIIQGKAEITP
jgi:HTH-type transcriptional regulator / antitoxin HigA